MVADQWDEYFVEHRPNLKEILQCVDEQEI